MQDEENESNKIKSYIQNETIEIVKTEIYHKSMMGIIGFTAVVCVLHYIISLFQDQTNSGQTKLKDFSSFLLLVVIVVEFVEHYCIGLNIEKVFNSEGHHQEYVIQVTEDNNDDNINLDEDNLDNKAKIKCILSKHIKSKTELNDCIDSILEIVDIDSDAEKENSVLPLHRDDYLPWQSSVLEPQNPYSFATSISMNTINNPNLPAFAPSGIPKKSNEDSKDNNLGLLIFSKNNFLFIHSILILIKLF